MKTLLKLIAVLVGLVVVLIGAAAAYIATLDPNDHKDRIIAEVKKQTGRDLALDGDLKLTLYPWLGLEANGVTLGNAPGFGEEPFLRAAHLQARAKTLPLFRKTVEMDTIKIEGAEVNLARNAEGVTNWADLVKADAKEEKKAQPLQLAALAIGGVDIRDARITWNDQAAGQTVRVTQLNVGTGLLTIGDPIKLNASAAVEANKPAIAGTIALDGTVAYDLDRGRFTLDPFQTVGKFQGDNLPGGAAELKFTTAADIDLEAETATVRDLNLDALGANVTGSLDASRIQSDGPAVKADLAVTGQDIALIFKALEIEPLASQLAKLKDKSFTATTRLDADMDTGILQVPAIDAKLLGATIAGTLEGANIHTDKPALKGDLAAKGPDLPTLLQVVGQFETGKDPKLRRLGQELSGAAAKDFDVKLSFDADMGAGTVVVPTLSVKALGTSVAGNLEARNVKTDTPAVKGELAVKGSDLPILLRGASAFQTGKEPGLREIAKQLAGAGNKAFDLTARFDADMKSGNIDVSDLSANALGIAAKGKLKSAGDSLSGELDVQGQKLGPLLAALGQGPLGEVLQSMSAQTKVSGSLDNFSLQPLAVKATIAGKQVPGGKVDLALNSVVKANLAQETLALDNLTVTGLGLNLQGNLKATNIKSDQSAFDGAIQVAPFDLRKLLTSLNQKLPPMADPNALKNVALDAALAGTANSVTVKNLALKLDGATVQGNATVNNFADPDVTFAMTADTLNVDRYLPPQQKGDKKPVTPEAAAAGAAQLPVEQLRALKLKGDATIGQLVITGLRLTNVKLAINARDGRIAATPMTSNLYDGTYTGSIGIDATGQVARLSIDSLLQGIQAEPLLTDLRGKSRLRGKGDFSMQLTAAGKDTDVMKKSLTGTAQLAFRDGAIKGINIGKVLRSLQGGVLAQNESEATDFTELGATLLCDKGVCRNNDLDLKSPLLRVGGEGVVANLHNDTIDYTVDATLAKTAAGQDGPELAQLGGVTIPIKVSGPTSDPKFSPDFGKIAKAEVQKQIDKQLDKQLDKLLGKDSKTTTGGATGTDSTAPAAPAKPEDQVKDALKNILRF